MADGSSAKETVTMSGNTMSSVETLPDGSKMTSVYERGTASAKAGSAPKGAAPAKGADKAASKKGAAAK